MEILRNKAQWVATFRENWLAYAKEHGKANWKLYKHPRNEDTPGTKGVKLSDSRLMLISSTGAYLDGQQEAFDAASLYGDYTIRTFPTTTPFSALEYAHDHYNQAMIRQDARVALPLPYLQEMVESGELGSLAPSVVSFMGYQPNSARVVDQMIPQIVAQAKAEEVDAALLAPV